MKNTQFITGAIVALGAVFILQNQGSIFSQPSAGSVQVAQSSQQDDNQQTKTKTKSNSNALIHSIDPHSIKVLDNGTKLLFTANVNGSKKQIEMDTDTLNFQQSSTQQATYQVSQDSQGNSINTVSLPSNILNQVQSQE